MNVESSSSLVSSVAAASPAASPAASLAVSPVAAALRDYATHELFQRGDTELALDNPYRRALPPPPAAAGADRGDELSVVLESDAGLFSNRVLLSIYERDFVLWPREGFAHKRQDFAEYYGPELTALGDRVRPHLEAELFPPLERKIQVAGEWTYERFCAYYHDFAANYRAEGHGAVTRQVAASPDPRVALRFYLMQAACDFLVESSAMGRNALGNFGAVQSELFKVIIDECGYGVDRTRHSTLFQRVLESVGLDSTPHTYWGYYLPTTLYTANYYNYIARNHARVFRYLGGLLHVESCFRLTCRQMAEMMRAVEGPHALVDYFTEHVHIDEHHSRMALENIIRPAVAQCGTWALEEVLRGFEESRAVGDLHTAGLARQLEWMGALSSGAALVAPGASEVVSEGALAAGEVGSFRIAPRALEIRARRGDLMVMAALGCERAVPEGQAVRVPAATMWKLRSDNGAEYEVAQ
ncbi:MAG: iron-containing redox enzyme family protein [Polyangiales bacterium]